MTVRTWILELDFISLPCLPPRVPPNHLLSRSAQGSNFFFLNSQQDWFYQLDNFLLAGCCGSCTHPMNQGLPFYHSPSLSHWWETDQQDKAPAGSSGRGSQIILLGFKAKLDWCSKELWSSGWCLGAASYLLGLHISVPLHILAFLYVSWRPPKDYFLKEKVVPPQSVQSVPGVEFVLRCLF